MDTLSYWTDTSTREKSWADNPIPDSVDVAIVGGGYTGLSAALHLAREGASVAVLETEEMGWGASGRNGGMVLPGLKHGVEVLIKRYGLAAAREMYAQSFESIDTVQRIIREEKIDCDYQDVGYFYAASKPAHYRHMNAENRALQDNFEHHIRLVPPGETTSELGSHDQYGGEVSDKGGGLHPKKYVLGLAMAADRAGASLHDQAAVTGVKQSQNGFEVTTVRGTVRAKNVLIGTNGYTHQLTPWIRKRVIPLGSYIIVTEPLDPAFADQLIPNRRMIFDSRNLLVYFRVLPDNRMMYGGRVSFVPATSERSGMLLRKRMEAMFPQMAGIRTEYSWGGYLGLAFDLMPHTGWRDGMLYSVAYAGHGVAMATYLGMKAAEVLSGKAQKMPFEGLSFPSWFFYQGEPWFMPLAGAWYRLVDAVS